MPGHSTKLIKIINIIASSSKEVSNISGYSQDQASNTFFHKNSEDPFMSELDFVDNY